MHNLLWLFETRMLKLRLQCTGKTPYDSNQQLSLQATVNPSALFIKLYATSEVPKHQALVEKYGTDRAQLPERGRAISQQCLTGSHGYLEALPVTFVPRVPQQL